MSALSTYLDTISLHTPPAPYYVGLVTHGSGAPTDATSPFYLFYVDDVADKTYMNPTRTSAAWIEVSSASELTGTVLTATT